MILDCFLAKNAVFAVKQIKIMLKNSSEKRGWKLCGVLICLVFAWIFALLLRGFALLVGGFQPASTASC